MPLFLTILLIILPRAAMASDGPQNSGVVTLERSDGQTLDGQLQIDRNAFEALSPNQGLSKNVFDRLLEASTEGERCELSELIPLASDTVVNAALTYTCSTTPLEIRARLTNPDALPEGFSLGVKTPSGHFSLDRATPEVTTIVSRSYLYFRAGLGFFGGSEAPELAEFGRQAPLWFGGADRLPHGAGLLFLLVGLWLSPASRRVKSALTIASIPLAALAAFAVLATKSTQSIHALLYVPHTTLGLVAIIYGTHLIGSGRRSGLAALVAFALATVTYGLELATMQWRLEALDGSVIFEALASFATGVALAVGCAALLATAASIALERLVGRAERLGRSRQIATGLIGLAGCAYLFVCLVARWRF